MLRVKDKIKGVLDRMDCAWWCAAAWTGRRFMSVTDTYKQITNRARRFLTAGENVFPNWDVHGCDGAASAVNTADMVRVVNNRVIPYACNI